MDPVLATVLFKSIGMLLVISGGIAIARYGFRLYRDGVGLDRDRAAFEIGPVKMKAHSVGSVVMATAFLWAWAGVALSPNLDKKGDDFRVYSFNASDVRAKSVAVEVGLQFPVVGFQRNPDKLKNLLAEAIAQTSRPNETLVELNGKRAEYDFASIRAVRSETGEYFLAADVEAAGETATIAYEPKMDGSRIRFVPTGIGIATVGSD